jgi:hypothetical protein
VLDIPEANNNNHIINNVKTGSGMFINSVEIIQVCAHVCLYNYTYIYIHIYIYKEVRLTFGAMAIRNKAIIGH